MVWSSQAAGMITYERVKAMATLEISVTGPFNDTGDLSGYQVCNIDPRRPEFDWDSVSIDLSRCGFIRPAAALWCIVYSLLVAQLGIPCKLTVPSNAGVRSHLNRLGLFEILESDGVEVDNLGTPNPEQGHLILPLTRLRAVSQVESLGDEVIDSLSSSNLSSSNLYSDVNMAFAELGNNAVEHADSPIDAYGFVQYVASERQPRFVCIIADGGIGIRASLQKNPEHEKHALTDRDAIEYATQENISVHGDTRGLGLAQIVEFVLPPNRELNITSGNGFLHVDGQRQTTSRCSNLFPGTSAFVNIPA